MNRVDEVREKHQMPYLLAHDVVKQVSETIADEIEAMADYFAVEGDLYNLVGGLRKAVEIAKNYKKEDW